MKTRALAIVLTALILIFSAVIAFDGFDIPRAVLSGGGGDAKSGNYVIHASVGQVVAGLTLNAPYAVESGFWTSGIPKYHIFLPVIKR